MTDAEKIRVLREALLAAKEQLKLLGIYDDPVNNAVIKVINDALTVVRDGLSTTEPAPRDSSAPGETDWCDDMNAAPKDGTKIDLWFPVTGRQPDCWFEEGVWCWETDEDGPAHWTYQHPVAWRWLPEPFAPLQPVTYGHTNPIERVAPQPAAGAEERGDG